MSFALYQHIPISFEKNIIVVLYEGLIVSREKGEKSEFDVY